MAAAAAKAASSAAAPVPSAGAGGISLRRQVSSVARSVSTAIDTDDSVAESGNDDCIASQPLISLMARPRVSEWTYADDDDDAAVSEREDYSADAAFVQWLRSSPLSFETASALPSSLSSASASSSASSSSSVSSSASALSVDAGLSRVLAATVPPQITRLLLLLLSRASGLRFEDSRSQFL